MTEDRTTEHLGEVVANLLQLESRNAVARMHAREHLVELGEIAVPALVETLRSAARRQRVAAAKVLEEIASPASAPALVAALEDEDPGVRWMAVAALKALGPEALRPPSKR